MDTIKKTSLSEAVTQRLLTLISEGTVVPGEKLPSESKLCEMLGVSRTALREGVKALVGINLLTVSPGRGTFVNENQEVLVGAQALGLVLGREAVGDVYEVRTVLDAGIARYATLRATEEDLTACRQALRKMERALERNPIDFPLAAEGDEAFHLALCEAAHNRLLANLCGPFINHAILRNWKLGPSPEVIRLAVEGHRSILAGIEKRDLSAVLDAVERHLKDIFSRLLGDDSPLEV